MTDPATTHAADQGRAASYDWGRMRAAFYRGARNEGAGRLLPGAMTLIVAWGQDATGCCDCATADDDT